MDDPDDLLPDLDDLRRDAIIQGLGPHYLPTYDCEAGTFDNLRPYGPKRFVKDLIELGLDAFYREEAG